jgi:hypothetical protein
MSVSLIIALNLGAAAFLALLVTALMLLPKRLHPHRHPHLEVDETATTRPSERPHEHSARPQRHREAGGGRPVTDS